MTRTTRQSVDKAKSAAAATTTATTTAEEMPPPPLPVAKQEDPIEGEGVAKRIRSPLFEKIFEKALKSSLSGITPDNWNKCFPTPIARRPEQMKEVRKKFCEIYELNVRKNFDEIIASRKLLASLDNLDILISEAQTRRNKFQEENPNIVPKTEPDGATAETSETPSTESSSNKPQPPPPLSEFTPDDLYMSHLYPLLQIQSARLEGLKLQQQVSIDKLIKRREEQQKEIQQLIATLEKRLAVVDEAAEGVKEICEMEMDDEEMEGT